MRTTKIPLTCSLFCVWVYFFVGSYWSEKGILTNIKIYILSLIVFFSTFGVTCIICEIVRKKDLFVQNKETIEKVKTIIVTAIGGGGILGAYVFEITQWPYYPAAYLRHSIPSIIYWLILISFTGIVLVCAGSNKLQNIRFRCMFSAFVAAIQGWFMYAPNFFRDTSGGLYHMDAYTNSIINSLSLMPHEQYSMSIYGHYGIFYILPVKMLHKCGLNYWESVTIAIALLGTAVFMLEYWILSQIIENDIIFFVAVLANAIVSVQIYENQFYQMLPHRYVFQALIIGGALVTFRKPNKKLIKLIMWILAGVAIVWNTETGLVGAIVWMFASIYLDAQRINSYKFYVFIKNFLLFLCSFFGSYVFVNLYNLVVGGKMVAIGTFLYPIGSNAYPVENIQCVLPKPMNGYIVVIFLTLGVIGYFLFKIVRLNLCYKTFSVVLTSMMGIGVFTYYMNRTVSSNASIVSFTVVILLSYICDNWIRLNRRQETNNLKKLNSEMIVAYLCFVIISSMALSTISTIGATLRTKIATTYEVESLKNFVNEIDPRIPKETVAFGIGTGQLFGYMNRKTGIYIADWEDLDQSLNGGISVINQSAVDYLGSLLDANDYTYILVNASQEGYLAERNYEECDEFQYNGFIFKLFKKNE